VGLDVNTEKIKYMVISHHQNTGKCHSSLIANKSFENVAKFKYLGITESSQSCIHEESKRRLNFWNGYYHSFQSFLSSCLHSKNFNIKIYKTIILPANMYRCLTWSLTQREEQRLRMFENRVWRRIFGPKREEVVGDGEDCIMWNFIT
jgi:hypothetical protein